MRARQPCGSCASSTSLSPRRTTASHVSSDDGHAPESSETLARYETTLIRVYPGVDTSRYVGVAGPPPSHVTGYQLNAPAEALLTNNTKRPLTTLMDFPPPPTLGISKDQRRSSLQRKRGSVACACFFWKARRPALESLVHVLVFFALPQLHRTRESTVAYLTLSRACRVSSVWRISQPGETSSRRSAPARSEAIPFRPPSFHMLCLLSGDMRSTAGPALPARASLQPPRRKGEGSTLQKRIARAEPPPC